MLVQDTPTSACPTGYMSTDTGLQAAYLALKPVFELQEKQKNARLALVNVPDVQNASTVVIATRRNKNLLDSVPRLFDSDDDDVCPDCVSRGLVIDDDGEFMVCSCVSFDRWAITWFEDVINRLAMACQSAAFLALESAS